MTLSRRQFVQAALVGVGGLSVPAGIALAEPGVIEIEMTGSPRGAAVWFDPIGLHVEPGTTIRWINTDRGNSHTATAYHPANGDYPRRIPAKAVPWDSGYVLPGGSFSVTLTEEGTYDYVCLPHEMAGMVGRIVVGSPQHGDGDGEAGLPEAVRGAFPEVDEIVQHGVVRHPRRPGGADG